MKKVKRKILITLFMLIIIGGVVLLLDGNTAFAAINTGYLGDDAVPDTNMDEAIKDSTLLKMLAHLVYAVGRVIEWLTGVIFKLLTGTSNFPWADKIVFNAVPLLDVNFINPAEDSFVGNQNIKDVLKSLYSTILALAISFFGIVVLITAIKLVISTIASDKAKYKQAIVDWLVGFVMLFCIHYGMSFIFYLNEQLVIVASEIVTAQLDGKDKIANVEVSKELDEIIANIEKSGVSYRETPVAAIVKKNRKIAEELINLATDETSNGIQEALFKDMNIFGLDSKADQEVIYKRLGMAIQWAADENYSVSELEDFRRKRIFPFISYTYLRGQTVFACDTMWLFGASESCSDIGQSKGGDYYNDFMQALGLVDEDNEGVEKYGRFAHLGKDDKGVAMVFGYPTTAHYGEYGQWTYITTGFDKIVSSSFDWKRWADTYLRTGIASLVIPLTLPIQLIDFISNGGDIEQLGFSEWTENSWEWSALVDDLISLKTASDTASGKLQEGSGKKTRLISDLASYFRYNAYDKEITNTGVGLKNGDNIQIENMLMYAILVVQSLILFIAYIKRLFYVIILAMMAPLVVVLDFFQKFGK